MKKVLSIALALTLVLCLAISASAAVEVKMDAEFSADGKVTDKAGNATMTYVDGGHSKIATTEVTHEGKTYNVPAFVIENCPVAKDSTDYIKGEYTIFPSIDEYYATFGEGFTVEVFFQDISGNKDKNPYASVVFGNCNAAGWAFVHQSTGTGNAYNGGVRFIVSTGTKSGKSYLAVNNGDPVYEQLTHVVATYSYDAVEDMSLAVMYINGIKVGTETKESPLFNWDTGSYKYFGIGANYVTSAAGVAMPALNNQCAGVIVVDAKMYAGAATADEVAQIYTDAVNSLEGQTPVTSPTPPQGGSITAPEGGWKKGTNKFKVHCEHACYVAISYDNGQTYTKIPAKLENGEYTFTADNIDSQTKISVGIAGDANGNGRIDALDARLTFTSIGAQSDPLALIAMDVNNNGRVDALDARRVFVSIASSILEW